MESVSIPTFNIGLMIEWYKNGFYKSIESWYLPKFISFYLKNCLNHFRESSNVTGYKIVSVNTP